MMTTDPAGQIKQPLQPSIVVKVGGSLYDHPALGPGLRCFLASLEADSGKILIVPGGGPFADAVRHLDRIHRLGESAAHQIALASLHAARAFLHQLCPGYLLLDAETCSATVETLPQTWAVTTDSIALEAANMLRARRLLLLKSVDIPSTCSWSDAATHGWIDSFFPTLAEASSVMIHAMNFRHWLNWHFPQSILGYNNL